MTKKTQAYSPGDWIVHRLRGVGQIEGTEVMDIGGGENTYYRIQTQDSMFWLPQEKLNADWLRPLASPAEIQQALEVLRHSPSAMDTDPIERKNRIKKVKQNFSPVVIAEILRDLWAHNKAKKQVSQTDLEALRYFMNFFLAEWSVCMDLEVGAAKQQLTDMLTDMLADMLAPQA
jgi:RNA polymerase-interacting CarD/CdnL/TRCF family regulator